MLIIGNDTWFLASLCWQPSCFGSHCWITEVKVKYATKVTLLFIINLFILFIYFWLRWVFIAVRGLSLVAVSRCYSLRCSARAFHCGGFSCCRSWALGVWASVVVACGLSSCGSRASLLCSMWDRPGPGLEPMSPALAGGFLTTVPPGKPLKVNLK